MTQGLRERIERIFGEVYRRQTGERIVPELEDHTVLLGTGMNSLGFAILVITLEDELGFDPFVLSEEAYYPRTFGEFVRFYQASAPK